MACLVACESCQRHVRQGEATCPFCAASLPPSTPCVPSRTLPRVASRAAIVLAGTALACACADDPGASPLYGVAVVNDGGNQVFDSGSDVRPKEASTDAPTADAAP